MRRLLIILLATTIFLSSCAVYTVGDGKANINIPQSSGEPETRYEKILENQN